VQVSRSEFLKMTHRFTQACIIRGDTSGCRRRIALYFSHDIAGVIAISSAWKQ